MGVRDEFTGASPDKKNEHQATIKIASAVESMLKQDGWKIFMALYDREKKRIRAKDDYASLEDFKADRKAIDIVDSVLDTFEGYMEDAKAASLLLNALSAAEEDGGKNRGIMLIEASEGNATLEG